MNQIWIQSASLLSGHNLAELIRRICRKLPLTAVLVHRVEAIPIGRLMETVDKPRVMSVDDFLSEWSSVEKFEWGDLYFFEELSEAQSFPLSNSYVANISGAPVTLRAVDDSELYVFSHLNAVSEDVLAHFPAADSRSGSPEDFEFPS